LAKGREYNADLAGVGVADLLPQLIKPFNIGFEFIFSDRRTALFRPIVLVEICLVGSVSVLANSIVFFTIATFVCQATKLPLSQRFFALLRPSNHPVRTVFSKGKCGVPPRRAPVQNSGFTGIKSMKWKCTFVVEGHVEHDYLLPEATVSLTSFVSPQTQHARP
jgi:hypothetical protein